jgi:hypothetical protein
MKVRVRAIWEPTHTLQRSEARSQGSVAGTVGRVQPFKDAIAQRSRPSWRRGYVPVTRLKRKERRTGFRQSRCDRSTILAGARFQPSKPLNP